MTIIDCNAGGRGPSATDENSHDSVCRFIESLVAASLDTTLAELRATSRGRASAAFARQTAMYLAHVHFGLSLSQVGRNFGRDRTTVSHACARVEDSRDDPKFERVLACLEAALDRWRQSALALGAH
jgi:chromosomal replication initiation ATPase DnaA